MHMVTDQYTKKDHEKFKNIVPKTPFFKNFTSTKKNQKTIQRIPTHWPPLLKITILEKSDNF